MILSREHRTATQTRQASAASATAASRAVLVTGCSSGIGRASALALARAGFPVWASARKAGSLGELEQAGCRVLELDVTDEQSRVAAVRQVEAEHGAVGVLVNNAGHGGGGPVEEVPLSLVRETFDTNVFGLIRMCQLALPCMRAQRSGLIVNLGSAAGPYAVFKANVGKMTARAYRDGARGVLDPGDAAKVIVKAVTARRPNARDNVGSQARLAPVARRVLGDRWWDAFMRRMVPFPAPQ